MGITIDAWIEYDDDAQYHPERAGQPPCSRADENGIPLGCFTRFRRAKDYRFFAAISGVRGQEDDPKPLFPMRGGLPPKVSSQTKRQVAEIIGEDNPRLSWLDYPEIERALAQMGVQREQLDLTTNLVLDLMQSIETRLGKGRSRLIFYIDS